jgi:hypothetical protein
VIAYGVQPHPGPGGADRIDKDRFEVLGKPDVEGRPNQRQMQALIQKLPADRFSLKFHHEKKELSVYRMVAGKTGAKLTTADGDPKGDPAMYATGRLPFLRGTRPWRTSRVSAERRRRPAGTGSDGTHRAIRLRAGMEAGGSIKRYRKQPTAPSRHRVTQDILRGNPAGTRVEVGCHENRNRGDRYRSLGKAVRKLTARDGFRVQLLAIYPLLFGWNILNVRFV